MKTAKNGFTIIELAAVIVIIGILGTFVTVQLLRGIIVSRDKERENDVKIITGVLENVHRTGQIDGTLVPTGDGSITTAIAMGYPSTALVGSPNDAQSKAILGTIDPNALKSPYKKAMSLVASANATGISGSTAGGITLGPVAANDVYVYQPLTSANALCTNANSLNASQLVIAPKLLDACVKFNLYYYSEASNSIKTAVSIDSNSNGL